LHSHAPRRSTPANFLQRCDPHQHQKSSFCVKTAGFHVTITHLLKCILASSAVMRDTQRTHNRSFRPGFPWTHVPVHQSMSVHRYQYVHHIQIRTSTHKPLPLRTKQVTMPVRQTIPVHQRFSSNSAGTLRAMLGTQHAWLKGTSC
jgi:hypothetical protein